ncbi:hypothetical protein WJX84_012036, partial [Apatococcus fuscideae]
ETSHLDGLSLLDYQSNLPQHLQRALEAAPVSIPPPEPPPPSIPHPSLDQLQSKPIFKHPQAPGNAQRAKRKSDITTAEPCSERLSGLKPVASKKGGSAQPFKRIKSSRLRLN